MRKSSELETCAIYVITPSQVLLFLSSSTHYLQHQNQKQTFLIPKPPIIKYLLKKNSQIYTYEDESHDCQLVLDGCQNTALILSIKMIILHLSLPTEILFQIGGGGSREFSDNHRITESLLYLHTFKPT
jgi:hypothetical protein